MGLYILISVLILIACVLLVLVVLVQNAKGGGLASNFSSSNQFMGVRKTADFLEKTTWTLAVILLVLSLFSIFVIPKNQGQVTAAERDTEADRRVEDPADQGLPGSSARRISKLPASI
ncbi:MAG: preprotein translocase subunit SecG [Marinilabiliales bacterium]|nr:preprotein translocase subunit SecG [Marinilabiliales bacterium]